MFGRHDERALALAVVMGAWAAATAWAGTLGPGDPFPEFDLPDLRASRSTAASLVGNPAVVEAFAAACRPCRASLPHLEELARRHGVRGLRVLAVSVDPSDEAARDFVVEHVGPTPELRVLRDPGATGPGRSGLTLREGGSSVFGRATV